MNAVRILGVLAAAALAALTFAGVEMGMAVRGARAAMPAEVVRFNQTLALVDASLGDVHAIEVDTQRTEAEMAGLLNQSRHAMLTQKQEAALVGQTQELLADGDTAVKNLGAAAAGMPRVLETTNSAIAATAADSHELLTAGTETLQNAARLSSDPELADTITQADHAARNLTVATGDAAQTMSELRAGVHAELESILAPARKVEVVAWFAARLAGRFFGY